MQNQLESESLNWFDELAPARAPAEIARQSSPSIYAIHSTPPSQAATVVMRPEPAAPRRVPVWALALAAIAGASAFVLGMALFSLL